MYIPDVLATKEAVKDSLHCTASTDRHCNKLDKNIRKLLRFMCLQRSKQRILGRLHLLHSEREKSYSTSFIRRDISAPSCLRHDCHSNFLAIFVFRVVLEKGQKV